MKVVFVFKVFVFCEHHRSNRCPETCGRRLPPWAEATIVWKQKKETPKTASNWCKLQKLFKKVF